MRLQPSAPRNELLGWNPAGELRIRIAARPVEGAANRELLIFLAGCLGAGRGSLRLEAGEKSRLKTLSGPSDIKKALLDLPDI